MKKAVTAYHDQTSPMRSCRAPYTLPSVRLPDPSSPPWTTSYRQLPLSARRPTLRRQKLFLSAGMWTWKSCMTTTLSRQDSLGLAYPGASRSATSCATNPTEHVDDILRRALITPAHPRGTQSDHAEMANCLYVAEATFSEVFRICVNHMSHADRNHPTCIRLEGDVPTLFSNQLNRPNVPAFTDFLSSWTAETSLGRPHRRRW